MRKVFCKAFLIQSVTLRVCKKFAGILSILHASGQVSKRAGGVSPPLDVQHASYPDGGLTPPARCAASTLFLHTLTLTLVSAFAFSTGWAQNPMNPLRSVGNSLRNIGRNNVEADPNKEYLLTEMEGPYLIFATALSGTNAKKEAHALVLELRKTYNWNAFVYEKNFTFDAKELNQGRNPHTGMRAAYLNPGGGTEYGILIGNFASSEDKQFEKTLAEVRKTLPKSLEGGRSPTPFSMAFGLPNPMLPIDHQRGGVDEFLVRINKDLPYSLLRNPRRYTVQIATFTGHAVYEYSDSVSSTLERLSAGNSQQMSELEKAEQSASKLCAALRERGVEAYEFHERHRSIVTVGSFDQYSQRLPNGTTRYLPIVEQTIQQYQGQFDGRSYKPVVIGNVGYYLAPQIIEVPRPR